MNFENIHIKQEEPYPEIVDAQPNTNTVNMLKDLASGRGSEFTAITQYSFQHIYATNYDEDIAKMLEEISTVEMKHLELLSSAIVSFGGKPIFQDGRGQYFSSSYANYTTNLKEMLQQNIKMETAAVNEYERSSQLTNNESLKQLFLRIREDEKLHLKIFKQLLLSVEFYGK